MRDKYDEFIEKSLEFLAYIIGDLSALIIKIFKCIYNNIELPTYKIKGMVKDIIEEENKKNGNNATIEFETLSDNFNSFIEYIKINRDILNYLNYHRFFGLCCYPNKIKYNSFSMNLACAIPSTKINVAYHEYQHINQNKEISEIDKLIEHKRYFTDKDITLEQLIMFYEKAIVCDDYEFYLHNHDKFMVELDADIVGYTKSLEFFKDRNIKLFKPEQIYVNNKLQIKKLDKDNYSFDWLLDNYNKLVKNNDYSISVGQLFKRIMSYKNPNLNGNNDIFSSLITSSTYAYKLDLENRNLKDIKIFKDAIQYQKNKVEGIRQSNEQFKANSDLCVKLLTSSKLYKYNQALDVKDEMLNDEEHMIESKTYSIKR